MDKEPNGYTCIGIKLVLHINCKMGTSDMLECKRGRNITNTKYSQFLMYGFSEIVHNFVKFCNNTILESNRLLTK